MKYFDRYDEIEPWLFEGEDSFKKDFNFIGYTYKMEQEPGKNLVKEELEKVERQKQEERELERANMKKKNKIMIMGQGFQDTCYSKNVVHRLQIN